MNFPFRKKKVYKGVIAGALGGLVASWVMPKFQAQMARVLEQQPDPHDDEEEDATVKTAQKISSAVADRELSAQEKKTAGPLVHYVYGTGIGMLYGGLAQRHEAITSGFGAPYGAAAWALGDEIAVPAFGLGKKPTEAPASEQVQALLAHLVYAVTLEGVRRLALKAM